jgi:2-(1,2-epoxy-1,2-dihydrophenyl)acetyl-CoA isomerase
MGTDSEPTAVRVERTGAVARVVYTRPAARGSFDVGSIRALQGALRETLDQPEVRAVVLTGDGPVFCSGADLRAVRAAGGDAARYLDDLSAGSHAVVEEITRSPKPVVAAVNGVAAGGGVGLALAADLVVMAESARFVLAFANLGLPPDSGASAALVRALGPWRAREVLMLDTPIDAATALAAGLVNRVVPDGELAAAAAALAGELAMRAPGALAEVKRLVAAAGHSPLAAILESERRGLIAAAAGADFREGLAAFLEKRPARFGA